MTKYLYGAEVNGIQSYIFQTGKLKEIVGGSEIVEKICGDKLLKEKLGVHFNPDNLLLSAAGKLQYIFEDEGICQNWIQFLSQEIVAMAPGLSLSQAIVKLKEFPSPKDFATLRHRLGVQKNKIRESFSPGLMIADRVPRTGGVVTEIRNHKEGIEKLDSAQQRKQEAADGQFQLFEKFLTASEINTYEESFASDFTDLLGKDKKSWIGVIHADGNSLGKLISKCQKIVEEKFPKKLGAFTKAFSLQLENATSAAVKLAFEEIVKPVYEEEKQNNPGCHLSMRPVILGGDDLTLIIRGNLAFDFAGVYLRQFENQTQLVFNQLAEEFGLDFLREGLSSCAGIAYIKFNYPFHYGADLAESLCKYAKKSSKNIHSKKIPSSLAFYKVQSSFIDEYEDLVKRELVAEPEVARANGETRKVYVRFNYGPYFLDKPATQNFPLISDLSTWVKTMNKKDAPKGSIREWLTELQHNLDGAEQMMNRIQKLNQRYRNTLHLKNPFPIKTESKNSKGELYSIWVTPLYDIINLASIHKSA